MKKNSQIIVFDETDDGDVALKFRGPSNTEIVQFRDAAIRLDQDVLEDIVTGLCLYPSDEEGPEWLKQLSEDDYFKYKVIVEEVSKALVERLRTDYDANFLALSEGIERNQQTALSCYKALVTLFRTGKPSVESDVALLYIHKALTNMANLKL